VKLACCARRKPAASIPEQDMTVLIEVVGGLVLAALIVRGAIAFYQDFKRSK
jgi:hypothetical protein